MMDLTKYHVIAFDIDGTLADRDTAILLPGVAEWFKVHYQDHRFAFATNQGGVGLRYWMERDGFGDPDKFPRKDDVMQHIGYVRSAISDAVREVDQGLAQHVSGLEVTEYVCFAYQSKSSGKWGPTPEHALDDPRWRRGWRKPSPGMLLAIIIDFCIKREQLLFVGDSDEDREAAANAGVDFVQADVFFCRDGKGE